MNAASNDADTDAGTDTDTDTDTDAVNAESQGAVTVLTMSFPARRNALHMALRGALQARSWTR